MVTLSAIQRLAEVVAESKQADLRIFVNAGFAAQREAKKKRRVDTLGTRISSAVARVLGLEEDTVSDSLARILDTSRDGAHVFLYEAFEPFIPPRRFKDGVTTEVRSAAKKGRPQFDSTLTFISDPDLRDLLRKRFIGLADRSEQRNT